MGRTGGAGAPEVIRFATIGSTNAEALRLAREGRADDAWLVAGAQSGGRGRHGRPWASPPGGLYATRLLVSRLPLDILVGLTLVAGVAAHEAATAVLPPERAGEIALKWPNDLLAGGRKLAGILIESEALGGGRTALAIGIGLNVAAAPAEAEAPAAALADLGATAHIDAVFAELAAAFARRLAVWDEGRGFPAIRAEWEARAMAPGTPTRVRLPGATLEGTYAGLDPSGALRLRLASGVERLIRTGEVVIPRDGTEKGARA